MLTPNQVFISSTCRDLPDLRAELAEYLEENGFRVRLSDSITSGFEIDPDEDTIGTCLLNVENSDVVLAIVDRRYGGRLSSSHPDYPGVSATHAELLHANKLGKPVLYFIREQAHSDYEMLKHDPTAKPRWIDTNDKIPWHDFVKSLYEMPGHTAQSRWLDTFKASTDLKTTALSRLQNLFPDYAGSLAMRPDRLVRLVFHIIGFDQRTITGHFENIGVGPALNIKHYTTPTDDESTLISQNFRGGLREGDRLLPHPSHPGFGYSFGGNNVAASLFCEYENRFQDRYRIAIRTELRDGSRAIRQPEEFQVWQPGGSLGQWIRKN